jgi:hypothetical protein
VKNMTIKELKEILNSYPEDITISVNGYEGGINDLVSKCVNLHKVNLNVNPEWYYGDHEVKENGDSIRLVLG